jgi:hypothetical protein
LKGKNIYTKRFDLIVVSGAREDEMKAPAGQKEKYTE